MNEKLKQLRKSLKLTQKAFAIKLGIKQAYYSELELGKKELSDNIIEKLVSLVGVYGYEFERNTSDIPSDILLGKSVGAVVGNRKRMQLADQFEKKVHEDLKKDNPEYLELFYNTLIINNLPDFIKAFDDGYLNKIHGLFYHQMLFKKTVPVYNDYKDYYLKVLKENEHLIPILEKFCNSVREFCKDFMPYDNLETIDKHMISQDFPLIKP